MIYNKETGWTWLQNSVKWHYFSGKRSLCGKYLIFVHPSEGYETGNDTSPDNCKACQKRLLSIQAKKAKRAANGKTA